jgi:hypothetical protein
VFSPLCADKIPLSICNFTHYSRVDGVAVADELRKLMLVEDSDHYDDYGAAEREEFIFRLMRHLVVGGGVGIATVSCDAFPFYVYVPWFY